ncbi:MAG: RHS repeat-associated core domain-containing protein [Chloroflexi bacterium]|nr:RHS repeat-associated core domain-containing protein [Chloroflexota bacterium]
MPFGDWRTEPDNLPTNRGFTGHVHNNLGGGADDLGLIYMNARFYLPALGRFASADTIVPNPTNPQFLNRYSYTRNSPLGFTDPTGHKECGPLDGESCGIDAPERELPLPPGVLPSNQPAGLTNYGKAAWNGLQAVQSRIGSRLKDREALISLINHEVNYNIYNSDSRDVIINQYNAYCSNGSWSTTCLNTFWGYSQVVRNGTLTGDGSERLPAIDDLVAALADSILNGTAKVENENLFHYGNALNDATARKLYELYQSGDRSYASYLTVTYCNGDKPCGNQLEDITGVFVVQTKPQNNCTGTLQDWVFKDSLPDTFKETNQNVTD